MSVSKLIHQSVDTLLPSMKTAMKEANKSGFAMVISIDATLKCLEISIGEKELWERDFSMIAHQKVNLSHKHKLPCGEIPPTQLEPDSIPFKGSWMEDGVTVGISGFDQHIDEAFAKCLIALIKANFQLARVEAQNNKELKFPILGK